MQLPKRHSQERRKFTDRDNHLTPTALARLEREIVRIEREERPKAVAELSRTREMGDLSENAGYQEAKGLVARLDGRLFSLRDRIKHAIVIEGGPDAQGRIRIGATATVRTGGKEKMYTVVGSQETSPTSGRISHNSPLGSALVGRKAGEQVTIRTRDGKEVVYDIIAVQ